MKKNLCIPRITSNDQSVRLISWLVKPKDFVRIGQPVLVIETSKVSVEVVTEFSGYLEHYSHVGDIVPVGACVAIIHDKAEEIKEYCVDNGTQKHFSSYGIHDNKFSNSAKRYIEENNLDLNDFLDMGLVTEEKIKTKLFTKQLMPSDKLSKQIFPDRTTESLTYSKLTEISILNNTREGLISSSLTIQFSSEKIRERLSEYAWINNRVSTYLLYVISLMLPDYPKFTAYYQNNQICFYNVVNLGVAMDLGNGLKVAVIKNASTLNLFDLHQSIIECIDHYCDGNFAPSLFSHSTITTTDLSNDGILYFQPVLNAKQSVIIGIGGDQSLPGSPITITAVFDHRILTGQEVAFFLKNLKEKILSFDIVN